MTRHAVKDAQGRIVADLALVEPTGEPVAFEKDGKPVAGSCRPPRSRRRRTEDIDVPYPRRKPGPWELD